MAKVTLTITDKENGDLNFKIESDPPFNDQNHTYAQQVILYLAQVATEAISDAAKHAKKEAGR